MRVDGQKTFDSRLERTPQQVRADAFEQHWAQHDPNLPAALKENGAAVNEAESLRQSVEPGDPCCEPFRLVG